MIALIDYKMGNLFSVIKAFEFCGTEVTVVNKPGDLMQYQAAVLPGVGNFGEGMTHLREFGLADAVQQFAATGKPLLGICLGMQMMLDSSEEAPGEAGLGLIAGQVKRFRENGEKVPQIGWNQLEFNRPESRIFNGIENNSFFYFVHSYYADVDHKENVLGYTDYMLKYASAIGRGNVFGMQFHPEKSQECGIQLLRNFVNLAGER